MDQNNCVAPCNLWCQIGMVLAQDQDDDEFWQDSLIKDDDFNRYFDHHHLCVQCLHIIPLSYPYSRGH